MRRARDAGVSVGVREVTDPHDPAIAGFGRMQTAAYYAPEALIPASYIPRLLDGAGRNFLVVAESGGAVVGAAGSRPGRFHAGVE